MTSGLFSVLLVSFFFQVLDDRAGDGWRTEGHEGLVVFGGVYVFGHCSAFDGTFF